MLSRKHAKASLKRKGWSYRRAAVVLEVSFPHLAKVMSGARASERLLVRIMHLPQSPVRYSRTGFALKSIRRSQCTTL